MEAVPPVRSSLLGILLLVMKLSVLVSGARGALGWGSSQSFTATSELLDRMDLSHPVALGDCLPQEPHPQASVPIAGCTANPRLFPHRSLLFSPWMGDDIQDRSPEIFPGPSLSLVQNRVHLYNLLLLKILFFNHWLAGLAQEAWGSRGRQAHPAPGLAPSPLGRALRAGLGLLGVPVWLGLWAPRLAWAGVRRCAGAVGLAPKRLGLSAATCADLLLSCLHGLMLAGLLLSLLTWRLCRRARRCSLRGLLSKALLDNRVLAELRALLKRLYWWVETTTAPAWHLAYLITWTTCLASHLLQAAFEHTAQLAQAQEAEPPQGSGPSTASPLPNLLGPKATPTLPEHGTLTE